VNAGSPLIVSFLIIAQQIKPKHYIIVWRLIGLPPISIAFINLNDSQALANRVRFNPFFDANFFYDDNYLSNKTTMVGQLLDENNNATQFV
jgi:hypothetical protein